MFGKPKESASISPNTTDKTLIVKKDSNESQDEKNFIFYNNDNQFSHRIEIYAIPNNIKNKKAFLVVEHNINFSFLCVKIAEEFESYPEFKNLSGLRVFNLTKMTTKNEVMNLPKDGPIHDFIKTGDIINCEITSQEYWIRIIFKLHSFILKKIIKLDYKLNKYLSFQNLKAFLLKKGCDLFIDQIVSAKLTEHFTYYIENMIFRLNNKEQYNYNEDLKDNLTISDLFDFESEIIVSIKFGIFEELIHNEIRNVDLPNINLNHLRFNDFKETDFDEFIFMKKFQPELNKIKVISKDFIKKHKNDEHLIYIYKPSDNINEVEVNDKQEIISTDHYTNLNVNKQKASNKMIIVLPYDTYDSLYSLLIRRNKGNISSTNIRDMKNTPVKRRRSVKNSNSFGQASSIPTNLNEQLLIEPVRDMNDSIDLFRQKQFSIDEEAIAVRTRRSGSIKNVNLKYPNTDGKSFLQSFRDSSKRFNLCSDFDLRFREEQFYNDIKKKLKFPITEEMIINLPSPLYRDYEILLDKNYRLSKENEIDNFWIDEPTILINNRKILLFVFLLLVYFICVIVVINYDFL